MAEFVRLTSPYEQEKILKAAGATTRGGIFTEWWLNGELVGFREEYDRDEDRMYFNYYIRKDLT